MKILLTSLSLAICAILGSCTSEGAAMSKDKLMETITGQVTQVVSKLDGVTDKASAEKAATAVEPMLTKAKTAFDSLKGLATGGAAGGAMKMLTDKLGPQITGLATKFTDKPEIMGVLKPVITKLKGLVGM